MVLTVFNACDLINLVTRYSCETFGMLIAIIYIYNGIYNLIDYFVQKDSEVGVAAAARLGRSCNYAHPLISAARPLTRPSPLPSIALPS